LHGKTLEKEMKQTSRERVRQTKNEVDKQEVGKYSREQLTVANRTKAKIFRK
jgi:hypothetical protein